MGVLVFQSLLALLQHFSSPIDQSPFAAFKIEGSIVNCYQPLTDMNTGYAALEEMCFIELWLNNVFARFVNVAPQVALPIDILIGYAPPPTPRGNRPP